MLLPESSERVLASLRACGLRGRAIRLEAMRLLDALDGYDWSGIYRIEGDELVLDEYVGAPTDLTRIAFGQGVCGTAVAENRNQVVNDVRECGHYLECSVSTRSEIVVLIRRGDELLGQIDIDGHRVAQFGATDEAMLEAMAELLAERWETQD